jgi:hypothetical protein
VDHPGDQAEALVAHRRGAYAAGTTRGRILVVAALAGATYAFPSSPLPALVIVAEWITGRTPPAPPAPPPVGTVTDVPAGDSRHRSAVQTFSILFAEQAEGDVTVSLTDGPNAVVRAFSGTATFTTDVDRLTIQNNLSTADYEIELPRDARWIEITVGPGRLFLKDGGRIVADVQADTQGRYLLPLQPPY